MSLTHLHAPDGLWAVSDCTLMLACWGLTNVLTVCLTVQSCIGMLLQVPIYVRALDLRHAAELKDAGASNVITATVETGLVLGSSLLQVSPALTQAWRLCFVAAA